MKAFIYNKARGSKKIAVLKGVEAVISTETLVIFRLSDGAELSFDKKHYKTTTYTN
jgi:hypothetical protein